MSDQQPTTVRETLRLMDESFDTFSAAAARLSAEEMNERLGEEAWTRKQMPVSYTHLTLPTKRIV